MAQPWERCDAGVRLRLRVQPRSARNRMAGVHGQALKLCVTAPPVDGQANEAIVALLAELLDVPKRGVEILAGQASRDKSVLVRTDRSEELIRKLEAMLRYVDKPKGGD